MEVKPQHLTCTTVLTESNSVYRMVHTQGVCSCWEEVFVTIGAESFSCVILL